MMRFTVHSESLPLGKDTSHVIIIDVGCPAPRLHAVVEDLEVQRAVSIIPEACCLRIGCMNVEINGDVTFVTSVIIKIYTHRTRKLLTVRACC